MHVLAAFRNGADGVIISGCLPTQCNYLTGNLEAIDRVDVMKKTLDVLGYGGERLETIFTSACMPTWLITMFNDFTEHIRKLNECQQEGRDTNPRLIIFLNYSEMRQVIVETTPGRFLMSITIFFIPIVLGS